MGLRINPVESVGSLLNPQQPPAPPAPMPAAPQTDITGAPVQSPLDTGMQGLLSNPLAVSFLLNMANGLLAGQQGIAQAAGTGLGGIGRFAATKATADKEAEMEERRRFESDRDFELRRQAAARSGSGSSEKPRTIGNAGFYSRVDEIMETISDAAGDSIDGLDYAAIRGRATIMAMQEYGDQEIGQYYQNLSPEARAILEKRVGEGGPAAWAMLKQQAQNYTNKVTGPQQQTPGLPADPGAPTTPGSPGAATPGPMVNTPRIAAPDITSTTPGILTRPAQADKDKKKTSRRDGRK